MHARGEEGVNAENANSGVQKPEIISGNYQHHNSEKLHVRNVSVFGFVCMNDSSLSKLMIMFFSVI